MLNETSGIDPKIQARLNRDGCPMCPGAKDIKLEDIEKGPGKPAFLNPGFLPDYCPFKAIIIPLLAFLEEWKKGRNDRMGQPLLCGIPALVEQIGEFAKTNLYALYGDLDNIREAALKLACSWAAAGLSVKYFFFSETEEELRKLVGTLGFTVMPEFVQVVCVAQTAKLVLESPRNDVLILPLLPFPEILRVLKGLALKSDVVIVGLQETFEPREVLGFWEDPLGYGFFSRRCPDEIETLSELTEYVDAAVTVDTDAKGSLIYGTESAEDV